MSRFDSLDLFYGVVFLAVLFLILGLSGLTGLRRAARAVIDRQMSLASDATSHEIAEALRRRRRQEFGLFGPLAALPRWLDRLIGACGLSITLPRLVALMAVLSGMIFAGLLILAREAKLADDPGPVSVLLGAALVAGSGGPILYLLRARRKRLRRFAEQLPDALDTMVRSLRVGHPISGAMRIVARDMPDPIGSEFRIAIDEMAYGLDFREVLANLAERIDVADLEYLVVSIAIQHESGGNLVEILEGLAGVVRARFRMFRKIRVLSAEARLSAQLMLAMPFVFGALAFASRADFYLSVIDDPLFFPILGAAFFLEVVGLLVMKRLIEFRV